MHFCAIPIKYGPHEGSEKDFPRSGAKMGGWPRQPPHLTSTETDDKLLIMRREKTQLFDEWPEAYDRWFTTPIGSLVKKV